MSFHLHWRLFFSKPDLTIVDLKITQIVKLLLFPPKICIPHELFLKSYINVSKHMSSK